MSYQLGTSNFYWLRWAFNDVERLPHRKEYIIHQRLVLKYIPESKNWAVFEYNVLLLDDVHIIEAVEFIHKRITHAEL